MIPGARRTKVCWSLTAFFLYLLCYEGMYDSSARGGFKTGDWDSVDDVFLIMTRA